ncbi:NUDIX domain-containing protein [Polaribacter sp.]|nr:NUDIX domain-containing protein [Polaribacter sp.]
MNQKPININDKKVNHVISRTISHIWGKLETVSFDFTFKNGKTERLTHEVYGKSDGVAILLFNKETKQVILTKQFRIPMYVAGVNNGFSYEVCGGTIDKNETATQSVIREAIEEVGYQPFNLKKVTTLFLSPGLVKEQVHLFTGEYSPESKVENGGGLDEENEEIEIMEVDIDEAFKMIANKNIVDARTLLLLQHIRLEYSI